MHHHPQDEGKCILVEKLIFGLRTGGAHFYKSLSAKSGKIKFIPSSVNPDIWVRKTKEVGCKYVETYVDDIIAFSHESERIL